MEVMPDHCHLFLNCYPVIRHLTSWQNGRGWL
jgi:REP element-mobilizing transposase RayT